MDLWPGPPAPRDPPAALAQTSLAARPAKVYSRAFSKGGWGLGVGGFGRREGGQRVTANGGHAHGLGRQSWFQVQRCPESLLLLVGPGGGHWAVFCSTGHGQQRARACLLREPRPRGWGWGGGAVPGGHRP